MGKTVQKADLGEKIRNVVYIKFEISIIQEEMSKKKLDT